MINNNLEFFQTVDRRLVSYDNILNFRFIIKNKGFNTVKKILFKQETNINQKKIFLSSAKNGIQYDPKIENENVNLGDLEPNEEIEVQINTVIEKPFKGNAFSIGNIDYLTIEDEKVSIISNEEFVSFKGADFQEEGEVKFYFDKPFGTIDDEIIVGIDIENKGNASGEKVIIGDIIPENCKYIENSLKINDDNIPFDGVLDTINVGRVDLFQRISVKYKIKIDREINKDILKHKVTLRYENILNEQETYSKIIKSNEALLNIKLVKIDNFKKTASKKEVTIGDKITFTIEGKNNGNLKLYDIILKDRINRAFKLIKDSTIINGVKAYNTNLEGGILLETLNVGDSFLVSYDVVVSDFDEDSLSSKSELTFKFDCEEGLEFTTKTINSEGSKVLIKAPNLKESKKFCNKQTAFLGDEVLSSISLYNTGNIRCENIVLADSVPEYLEFIPNSLFINGEKIYSSSLGEININWLDSGEKKEISYRAKVVDIPKYNRNKNKVKAFYNYKVDGKECNKETIFYGDEIVVNGAIIKKKNIVKTVDRLYGIIGDEITYNITFKNEGNFSCEKVFIKEEENRNLKFIQNSLNINGIETPYDIYKGFLYGEIDGGETINISFRCKIQSIPYSSVIQGITYITYEYRGENGTKRVRKEVSSKSEEIIVKSAVIDNGLGIFSKETPNSVARAEDRIPIRIHLRNMGNTDAYNVVLRDEKIKGIQVIEESFTVDGERETYGDGTFNIGNLKVNEEKEILYFAKVTREAENNIKSKATVEYCFYGNDGGTLIKGSGESKTLEIKVFNASLLMTESVNKDSLEVGEVLNYNLYITNNGNINLRNLKLNLNVSNIEGLYLNELTINRKLVQGVGLNNLISIGAIEKNESILICMKIGLNKLLMKNTLSLIPKINGVYESDEGILTTAEFTGKGREINVSLNTLTIQKTAAKKTYLKGETVNYLITVRNDGTNAGENIIIYDSGISEGFVEDSLTINGYPVETSFVSGIPVGSLKQGECAFIRYSAIYNNEFIGSEILSVVKVACEFLDEKYGYMKKEFYSEEFKISLVKASLKIVKTADKRILAYGDKVNFITTVENNGTVPIFELNFSEIIPKGFIPITSSIYVNGSKVIKGDCSKGLPLPPVEPRDILEVSTQYEYKNYKRMQRLQTESHISYAYELKGNKDIYIGDANSNKVLLEGEIATFRNLTIDHEVVLKDEEVWIGEVTDVIVVPKITKSYVVKTIQNTSYGNEKLTGYKLIIRGVLEEKIEYIANTEQESVHMVMHEERFSTSIILPEQHDINEEVNIHSTVHQVFPKVIDDKRVQISVNLTVQGLI